MKKVSKRQDYPEKRRGQSTKNFAIRILNVSKKNQFKEEKKKARSVENWGQLI